MIQTLFTNYLSKISLKKVSLIGISAVALSIGSMAIMGSFSSTVKAQEVKSIYPAKEALRFGEWRYIPTSNPPTLTWWNDRMSMVPVLTISFLPDKIVLNAVTPVWPDNGIIFYIKDKTEIQGINLSLNRRDNEHCVYEATIYGQQDQQTFINNLVTSRKSRLITPTSYSQSLSLKHVYAAMKMILSSHPELHFSLPDESQATK